MSLIETQAKISPIDMLQNRRYQLVKYAKDNRRVDTIIKLGSIAGIFIGSVSGIGIIGSCSALAYGTSIVINYARTGFLSAFPYFAVEALSNLNFGSNSLVYFLSKTQQYEFAFLNSDYYEDALLGVTKVTVDQRWSKYNELLMQFIQDKPNTTKNIDDIFGLSKQVLRVIEDCEHDDGMSFDAVRKSKKWGKLVSMSNPTKGKLKAALDDLVDAKLITFKGERYFIHRKITRLKRWLKSKIKQRTQ